MNGTTNQIDALSGLITQDYDAMLDRLQQIRGVVVNRVRAESGEVIDYVVGHDAADFYNNVHGDASVFGLDVPPLGENNVSPDLLPFELYGAAQEHDFELVSVSFFVRGCAPSIPVATQDAGFAVLGTYEHNREQFPFMEQRLLRVGELAETLRSCVYLIEGGIGESGLVGLTIVAEHGNAPSCDAEPGNTF